MTPEEYTRILTGIISVLLSGGFILALVAWRKQRKQEPIDAETAAVVNARTAGELALAVAKQQEGSINVLREDLKVVREDLDAAREELTRLRSIIPWIRDLFDRWHIHREHEKPPGGLPPGLV